ncbi:MAG: exodeoxyribonuclease VII large subunit, partial [Candidatus Rokubacteria bacterium]|nr:exodeoxyribonuclease VII large subunit [Candidatus Rokubacteria bacterium]
QVWTVAELTQRIKELLEERFPAFWVEGEISNLRVPSSGHAYFTLKDESAQLKAVLFRNRMRRVRFEPEDGLHVLAFGSLDVYAVKGEYQLVVELLEPKGLGALQLAFEQRKVRLAAEGLFDPARKRPLPRFPRKIGIVTSPTGAAVRDILKILSRRFADLHLLIAPVRVQGEGAAEEIVQALADLNGIGDLDVVIVARGGGSLEDLWAFNEEAVARAIAASKVPVISAVGHETDVTIADFVADVRAPTPSAAAELVVEEKAAVVAALVDLHERLTRSMRQRLERHRALVEGLARRRVLTDPARAFRDLQRRVDDLTLRLGAGLSRNGASARQRFAVARSALSSRSPLARIADGARLLEQLDMRIRASVTHAVERSRHRLGSAVGQLDSLSPLSVLRRGYSLTRLPSGEIVRSWSQAGRGSAIEVLLHEGTLDCLVEQVRERDDRPQV